MEFTCLLTIETNWTSRKLQEEITSQTAKNQNWAWTNLKTFPEKKKKISKTYIRVLTTFITLKNNTNNQKNSIGLNDYATHLIDSSSALCASPTAPAPTAGLVLSKAPIASRNPLPSSPITWLSGTTTSSKDTALVSEHFWPMLISCQATKN